MSLVNTYVSTPGTLFNIPSGPNTYVYLLSSINSISQEIIVRNAGTSPFIVSTTKGLRFSPSLSTQTLSSFTATAPYSFISVVPRTRTEYMLLEAPGFPTRTSRLDLNPNYLFLSTLSTLELTATTQAALGNFTIGTGSAGQPARIISYPGATTTLTVPAVTAPYVSIGTLYASTVATLAATTAAFTTATTPIVNTSAYIAGVSTLTTTTVSNAATFQGDLTQTDGLGLGSAALYTVGGAATFNSTVQTTTARFYGPAVAGFSTLTVAGALTATATFSTIGSFTTSGETRTDGTLQANQFSTISYNALATAHPTRVTIGTSNVTPYTAYIQGSATYTAPLTATGTSSITLSTAYGTYSTLLFIDPSGNIPSFINANGGILTLNGSNIQTTQYTPVLNTLLASNYINVTGELRTSTLLVNQAYPINYNVSSPLYTLDLRGNMYVSTAFVMENMAIYGGSNSALYTTPAFNTIYSSTNGLLINNRLFVDGLQNRVGVDKVNPAYTLDVSGLLYVAATNVFNVAGSTWISASDSALKENIADLCPHKLKSYSAVIEELPLKRFRFQQDRIYYVDVSRQMIDADGIPIVDAEGNPVMENVQEEHRDTGFASEYRLDSAYRYGFIAQDVELFFPNSVQEKAFYKYSDFHFMTPDSIFNAQYATTRTMISTVVGHSTVIGHRFEFISTVSQRQRDLLGDLSGNYGAPFNGITIGNDLRWTI